MRAALGDRVLLLDHVGSASVPGLSAKPIIDVVLAVADSDDEAHFAPALQEAGHALRAHARLPGLAARAPGRPRDLCAYEVRAGGPAWESVDDYARAKTAVISQILEQASEEKAPALVDSCEPRGSA